MRIQATLDEQVFDLDLTDHSYRHKGEERPLHVRWLSEHSVHLLLDHRSLVLTVEKEEPGAIRVTHKGQTQRVHLKTERDLLLKRMGIGSDAAEAPSELRAPMPGLVLQINVSVGDEIEPGQGLIVLEAMKMENELRADHSAVVETVHVEPGTAVGKNELLVTFER